MEAPDTPVKTGWLTNKIPSFWLFDFLNDYEFKKNKETTLPLFVKEFCSPFLKAGQKSGDFFLNINVHL